MTDGYIIQDSLLFQSQKHFKIMTNFFSKQLSLVLSDSYTGCAWTTLAVRHTQTGGLSHLPIFVLPVLPNSAGQWTAEEGITPCTMDQFKSCPLLTLKHNCCPREPILASARCPEHLPFSYMEREVKMKLFYYQTQSRDLYSVFILLPCLL